MHGAIASSRFCSSSVSIAFWNSSRAPVKIPKAMISSGSLRLRTMNTWPSGISSVSDSGHHACHHSSYVPGLSLRTVNAQYVDICLLLPHGSRPTLRLRGLPGKRFRPDDFPHRRDRALKLFVGVEEVRAEAQAHVRSKVAENVPRLQLRVHRGEVRRSHDDRAAAASRLERADDLEPGLVEQLDQQLRLAHRFRTDAVDADLLHDLVACGRRVEGRHVR